MSDRDYYEILGLTPRADGAMVDQAYWHLARTYQSLAPTDPRARGMLDELNEAYGVVGSSRLREQYDAFRDDVLIRKGMIKPISSRRSTRPLPEAAADVPGASPDRRRLAGLIPHEHARTYAISAIIAALALAAAWDGMNPVFVISTLVAGLALSLTPALRRQLPDITMPSVSMPSLSMPELPRVSLPKLPDVQATRLREIGVGASKDDPMDAGELHASTAAMISRWRDSVGLRALAPSPDAGQPDGTPSTALVDIVESERGLDDESAPLSVVIDILRGAHRSTIND